MCSNDNGEGWCKLHCDLCVYNHIDVEWPDDCDCPEDDGKRPGADRRG
jgi:hypothetical protein